MREATLTELHDHIRHLFDLVSAGESIRILRNGKPVADILPVPGDIPSWKKRRARPLAISGVRISRVILEERGE
ncbi:MAG: prevent-host-death protein [Gammaproteobacteria bacterium]|nr:prevent-host-death protein [Gammaproteobacteria bacterium]